MGSVLSCVVNRAERVFAEAVAGLQSEWSDLGGPVCFTYWDTFGGKELPGEKLPPSGRVIQLIDRRISNRLANKKNLMERLRKTGTEHLAPPAYASVSEALQQPDAKQWPLWFCKPIYGSAGKGMYCLRYEDLGRHELPPDYIIQAGVRDPVLLDGKKCTTRIYVLLWNRSVYLYRSGFVICNGPDYDPLSTDYAMHIGHEGYLTGAGGVRMFPLATSEKYEECFSSLRALVVDLRPVLAESLAATGPNRYLVLGIDTLIDAVGRARLIEINNYPNFIHTSQIMREVNVPFFQSVIRKQLGRSDGELIEL